jgi:hypothetical protein
MENRFPIFDVSPVVHYGDAIVPAKAIAEETVALYRSLIK